MDHLRQKHWVNVPPVATRVYIIRDTHETLGHIGRKRLIGSLKQWYWWPGLANQVRGVLKNCQICQLDNPRVPPLEKTRFIEPPQGPFKGWSLDLAGPFPRDIDGNQYLVVAVDTFSKWVEAEPM